MRSPAGLEKQRRTHVDKLLRAAFEKAHNDALAELERRARFALLYDPMVVEFVMAMGTASFVRKDGGDEGDETKRPRLRPTFALLEEWDFFNLTGTPMRFTAHGPIVREW